MTLSRLEKDLGWEFSDKSLLEQALTHRSWSAENGGEDNERLEFLGDAVLQLVVTDLVMAQFPDAPEGQLSRIRAGLVQAGGVAFLARAWNLGEHVRLGKGEDLSGGRDRDSVLADVGEAVLGAIYREGGLEPCHALLESSLKERLKAVEDPATFGVGPKTLLQELTVARWNLLPTYSLVNVTGPDHARQFRVRVHVGERYEAEGVASSKRNAQRAAAAKIIGMLAAMEQVGVEE
ncbi:MAG: ribonuclease III [Myxococcota bacterium]|nr:ribonuclease III [Myxococcota bacterium]